MHDCRATPTQLPTRRRPIADPRRPASTRPRLSKPHTLCPTMRSIMHANRLHLLLPFALPAAADASTALHDIRSPALDRLIARATLVERVIGEDFQRTLPHERWVGAPVRRAADRRRAAAADEAPLAPYMLRADGGEPGSATWACVQPVHVRIAHDHLVLIDPGVARSVRRRSQRAAGGRPAADRGTRRAHRGAEARALVSVGRRLRHAGGRVAVARERPQHRNLAAARSAFRRAFACVDEAAERSADGLVRASGQRSARGARPARRQFDLVSRARCGAAGAQPVRARVLRRRSDARPRTDSRRARLARRLLRSGAVRAGRTRRRQCKSATRSSAAPCDTAAHARTARWSNSTRFPRPTSNRTGHAGTRPSPPLQTDWFEPALDSTAIRRSSPNSA